MDVERGQTVDTDAEYRDLKKIAVMIIQVDLKTVL